MATYLTSFFYWYSPVKEYEVIKRMKESVNSPDGENNGNDTCINEPVIIQAAARNMPNGMLDPSKFSEEEAEKRCTFQKMCVPICVTKEDLDKTKLRKTKTRPPRTKFMPRSPVCEEILLRECKKSIQQILIKELSRYFKEHPGSIVM